MLGLSSDNAETVEGFDNPTYGKNPAQGGEGQSQDQGEVKSAEVVYSDIQNRAHEDDVWEIIWSVASYPQKAMVKWILL